MPCLLSIANTLHTEAAAYITELQSALKLEKTRIDHELPKKTTCSKENYGHPQTTLTIHGHTIQQSATASSTTSVSSLAFLRSLPYVLYLSDDIPFSIKISTYLLQAYRVLPRQYACNGSLLNITYLATKH